MPLCLARAVLFDAYFKPSDSRHGLSCGGDQSRGMLSSCAVGLAAAQCKGPHPLSSVALLGQADTSDVLVTVVNSLLTDMMLIVVAIIATTERTRRHRRREREGLEEI
jgi:hypothetical protein